MKPTRAMTRPLKRGEAERPIMLRAVELMEFDAASYDLSARFARNKSAAKAFRVKERQRRSLIARIRALLSRTGRAGKGKGKG